MSNASDFLPDELREATVRPAEHELFFTFNSDEHAEAFHDWWHTKGKKSFVKWVESVWQKDGDEE